MGSEADLMMDSLRLFLVEEEDDIALLIRKTLERAGHEVTTCRTAADALIVLSEGDFNLVLLDQRLPDMSGLELLQTLQRDGIAIPVLMVTAGGDGQLVSAVLRAGALDYVVKDEALTFLADLPKRISESVNRHRLQNLNRLLSEALNSARDGLIITHLDGTIMHVNGALEQLSGYARNDLLGQNVRLFQSDAHSPEVYTDLWRTVLARASWEGELTSRRKDGGLFEVSLTVSPIRNAQGQMTYFVGICQDVSERKQLQRQLLQAQKMQSVGTLAGGVAHEFNNLLAGIQGYASLCLREQGLSEPVQKFLNNIVALSDRAAGLTRQLLTFARKPALQRLPTDLADLVRTTADLVTRTLKQEVVLECPPPEEADSLTALADPNELQQSLVNLALNARDALPEPVPIVFRLRHLVLAGERTGFPDRVPPGDYVVLEVEDRGSGMEPDVLSQALDPFFTTKGVGQGTGLGLPVVFGIVHGHQGFLILDTAPGEGTCVGLYLPRLVNRQEKRAVSKTDVEKGPAQEPETIRGRTILVVDDEEAVLDVVRRFLEIGGHQVWCAASGKEAFAQVERGAAIDLIILDLMMPHEEENIFQRLRHHLPRIPILLCTGMLQAEPAQQLLEAGAAGILRKPFRMNELWAAVDRALAAV